MVAVVEGGWHYKHIEESILGSFDPRDPELGIVKVLEAGGGSSSHIALPDNVEITTIDISVEQLERNTTSVETILGDLETYDYGDRRFDLIIVWDVMEHLANPEAALERFDGVLNPGGFILVKGPMVHSVKGIGTKYTPHAFHVAFYKYILETEHAGEPGYAPFPTYLADMAGPMELRRYFTRKGYTLRDDVEFESTHIYKIEKKSALLFKAYRAVEFTLDLVTKGKYKKGITDFYLIAQKSA